MGRKRGFEMIYGGKMSLAAKYNLHNLVNSKGFFIANVSNYSQGSWSWNLEFGRAFNDWEIDDVYALYSDVENQRLEANQDDTLIWNLSKNKLFQPSNAMNT